MRPTNNSFRQNRKTLPRADGAWSVNLDCAPAIFEMTSKTNRYAAIANWQRLRPATRC